MKPLLENEIITEEVYNEVLENLYDEFEVWRYSRIQNPSIEFRKKKREARNDLLEQNPGYISLTESPYALWIPLYENLNPLYSFGLWDAVIIILALVP